MTSEMLYDIEKMLIYSKSKYRLVNLLSKRARELNRWAGPETDISKIIPIVIEELLQGKFVENKANKKEQIEDHKDENK